MRPAVRILLYERNAMAAMRDEAWEQRSIAELDALTVEIMDIDEALRELGVRVLFDRADQAALSHVVAHA